MGANEKHDATYHGHTPTIEDVRERYIQPQSQGEALDPDAHYIVGEEFDRAIAKVRAEAKAEAWEECARSIVYEDGTPVEIASITNPYK